MNFPTSPTVGTYTINGKSWYYNGKGWLLNGVGIPYVLGKASATVLGGIKIGTGLSIDSDGVVSAAGGGGGATPVTNHLATMQVNQALALAPAISVTVAANTVYKVDIRLVCRPSTTAIGIAVGLQGTCGLALCKLQGSYGKAAGVRSTLSINAKDVRAVFTGGSEFSDPANLLVIEGLVHTSGAGTFILSIAAAVEWDYWQLVPGSFVQLTPVASFVAV